MLSEVHDPIVDVDKCILHELIIILQKIIMTHLLMFIKQDLVHT
jgi:hypothetical protein